MVLSCLCCFQSLVPEDHIQLSRDELKILYEKSIAVNYGKLIVHGIFARADTKNNNKRIYPRRTLQREVDRFDEQHIKQGTALGELDHPNYASRYFKCLNLPNISHQVLDVKWKGNQLWGTIEVLPTPSGLLLWELYSQGIRLGVSSRGWASLKSDTSQNCLVVDDDFELITFDFVTEPSTKDAYLVPVQKAYRKRVPNQEKCVQTAHLGHGVVSMDKIVRLPPSSVLVQRIAELQRTSASRALAAGIQQQDGNGGGNGVISPNAASAAVLAPAGQHVYSSSVSTGSSYSSSSLDNLLRYSHYLVHQEGRYLDREQHARDYRAHLAIFATRAHLADQQQLLSSKALDHVILHEIASRSRFDPASKSFATALGHPKGQPLNDSFEKNRPDIENLVSASAAAARSAAAIAAAAVQPYFTQQKLPLPPPPPPSPPPPLLQQQQQQQQPLKGLGRSGSRSLPSSVVYSSHHPGNGDVLASPPSIGAARSAGAVASSALAPGHVAGGVSATASDLPEWCMHPHSLGASPASSRGERIDGFNGCGARYIPPPAAGYAPRSVSPYSSVDGNVGHLDIADPDLPSPMARGCTPVAMVMMNHHYQGLPSGGGVGNTPANRVGAGPSVHDYIGGTAGAGTDYTIRAVYGVTAPRGNGDSSNQVTDGGFRDGMYPSSPDQLLVGHRRHEGHGIGHGRPESLQGHPQPHTQHPRRSSHSRGGREGVRAASPQGQPESGMVAYVTSYDGSRGGGGSPRDASPTEGDHTSYGERDDGGLTDLRPKAHVAPASVSRSQEYANGAQRQSRLNVSSRVGATGASGSDLRCSRDETSGADVRGGAQGYGMGAADEAISKGRVFSSAPYVSGTERGREPSPLNQDESESGTGFGGNIHSSSYSGTAGMNSHLSNSNTNNSGGVNNHRGGGDDTDCFSANRENSDPLHMSPSDRSNQPVVVSPTATDSYDDSNYNQHRHHHQEQPQQQPHPSARQQGGGNSRPGVLAGEESRISSASSMLDMAHSPSTFHTYSHPSSSPSPYSRHRSSPFDIQYGSDDARAPPQQGNVCYVNPEFVPLYNREHGLVSHLQRGEPPSVLSGAGGAMWPTPSNISLSGSSPPPPTPASAPFATVSSLLPPPSNVLLSVALPHADTWPRAVGDAPSPAQQHHHHHGMVRQPQKPAQQPSHQYPHQAPYPSAPGGALFPRLVAPPLSQSMELAQPHTNPPLANHRLQNEPLAPPQNDAKLLAQEQQLGKQRSELASEFLRIQRTLSSYARVYEWHQQLVEKDLVRQGALVAR